MPRARASSGLPTIALMRVPVRLRPYQSTSAPSTTTLTTISTQPIARIGGAEHLDVPPIGSVRLL